MNVVAVYGGLCDCYVRDGSAVFCLPDAGRVTCIRCQHIGLKPEWTCENQTRLPIGPGENGIHFSDAVFVGKLEGPPDYLACL